MVMSSTEIGNELIPFLCLQQREMHEFSDSDFFTTELEKSTISGLLCVFVSYNR